MRPQEVDFGVIGEAWNLLKAQWLNYGAFSLIGLIVAYSIGFIIQLPGQAAMVAAQTSAATSNNPSAVFGAMLVGLPFQIASTIVQYFVMGIIAGGVTMMALKQIQTGSCEIADGFAALKQAVPFGLASMLLILVSIPGTLLCIVGAFWVMGLFSLAIPAIAVERLSLADGIKRSLALTKPHWLIMGAFYLVIGLLSGLGVLACCIGIALTVPLGYIALLLVYRDLSGINLATPFGTPEYGTPYPREAGGNMPAYTGPVGDTPPTDPTAVDDMPPSPSESPSDMPRPEDMDDGQPRP